MSKFVPRKNVAASPRVALRVARAMVVPLGLASALTLARPAHAADGTTPPAPGAGGSGAATSTGITADLTPESIDLQKDTTSVADVPGPPPEAPPPPPYKKSVVIDSSIGALVFLGEFGKVVPPAPWLHTQVGYEIFRWFMLFGEGEVAFTDTSGSQAPPKTRAFPMFGFGGGARFTVRPTPRVGIYLQGSVGAMKADVATNALSIIGFKDAESLGLYFGGRLGVEWYQLDRHFALGLTGGVRDATGFAKTRGASDTPLAFDAGASIRYAF